MKANRILIVLLIIVFVLSLGLNLLHQKDFQNISSGIPVLDMQRAYSPEAAFTLIDTIGKEGRELYTNFLFFDFIFIASFAFLQSLLMSRMLKKTTDNRNWQKLKYLAYIRGFFDSAENIMILSILYFFPIFLPALAIAASVMTVLKWISLILIITVMSACSLIILSNRFSSGRQKMKKQITVIGILSSPRKNGNTAPVLRKALEGAKKKGAIVKEIFLQDYSIAFCKGCLRCLSIGDCVIKDDIQHLKKIITDADGIIFASPNYANSINAVLKQFLERIGMFEFLTSSMFGGKYVAGIATTGGSGAEKVAKGMVNLAMSSVFQRGYVSGTLGVSTMGKNIADIPGVLQQAEQLGEKLAHDILGSKKYRFQNIMGRLIAALAIKPSFKKFIIRDKETSTKAVYRNLKLRALI